MTDIKCQFIIVQLVNILPVCHILSVLTSQEISPALATCAFSLIYICVPYVHHIASSFNYIPLSLNQHSDCAGDTKAQPAL